MPFEIKKCFLKKYVASHSYFLCIKTRPSMVSGFLQYKSGWHRILEDEFLANNTIDLRDSICISLLCDCSHSVPSSLEAAGDASYQTLRLNLLAIITIHYLPQRLSNFFQFPLTDQNQWWVMVSIHHGKYPACSPGYRTSPYAHVSLRMSLFPYLMYSSVEDGNEPVLQTNVSD